MGTIKTINLTQLEFISDSRHFVSNNDTKQTPCPSEDGALINYLSGLYCLLNDMT